jgi:hypothetical protein
MRLSSDLRKVISPSGKSVVRFVLVTSDGGECRHDEKAMAFVEQTQQPLDPNM